MEGTVFVMPRFMRMVERQNTWGVAMTERARRGKMRMLEEMEMTEIGVWRARGVTAIHLQAPLGGLMMTRTTFDLDQPLSLDSPLPRAQGYDFFTELVGQ